MRWLVAAPLIVLGVPAEARDALGIFDSWGAFRDQNPARCFAIAEPFRATGNGKWRPFASVAHWPGPRIRGQLHIRLSREKRAGAPVTLQIDEQRFDLSGSGGDAWAANAGVDARIVAAMRSGKIMAVATVAATGGGFSDTYRLKGAATAIDAAALGCARSR